MTKPWPKSREELNEILDSIEAGPHDYDTSAEALANAALAAFNYMSHKVGATGFQASWAELQFLAKSRGIDGPFTLIKLEDAIYPQYDIKKRVEDFLGSEDSKKWLKEKAAENLTEMENNNYFVHPNVIKHWVKLTNKNTENYDKYVKAYEDWFNE